MPKQKRNKSTKVSYFQSESQRKKTSRLSFIYGSRRVVAVYSILIVGSLIVGGVILQKTRDSKAATASTFSASADTYVTKPLPSQTLNEAKEFWVRGEGTNTSIAYLRFNVSGISGRTISDAKLRLYHLDNPSPSGGQAYLINWDWGYNPTWNRHPGIPTNAPKLGELGRVDKANTYYEMPLIKTGWKDGVVTIALKSNVDDGLNYSSAQGGRAPQLVLSTGTTGGSPTPTPTPTPPAPEPTPTPTPQPTGPLGSNFNDPFPNTALRRNAAGMGYDQYSTNLVNIVLRNASERANSGRGPSIFTTGEKRYQADNSMPLWTFYGSGTSYQMNAPSCIQDSGSADPTLGIYHTDGRVVRMWGGDSVPISINCSAKTARASSLGVDTNGDGKPEKGIGTAGGLMSGNGIILPNSPKSRMVKFALGNSENARSFRPPAIRYESKSTGQPYPNGVPHGTVFCHLWTSAEIDAMQANARLSGSTLTLSDNFWDLTSCSRGKGMILLDGTGNGGFNLYINQGEFPSGTSASMAVRMPTGGNSSSTSIPAWEDWSKWRALAAQ